jgi:hypothetical protein
MLSQMRLLREPLAHFAVLGALLFAVWGLARPGRAGRADPPPRPATDGAPRVVAISTGDVDAARATFRAVSRREPNPQELGDLVQTLVSEELLYREALALDLDRDDRVVRRRLIEKATALARPTPPNSDPPRDELLRHYASYRHRFHRPATVTFEQRFFDPQRRDDPAAAAGRALALLGDATRAAPRAPAGDGGDPSVFPATMESKSELELAHLLGDAFAAGVMTAPIGRWQGPLPSKHGVHLVRVTDRRAERMPPFEEVEKQVRADWLTQETRGLRAAALTLLPRYEISLPAELRSQLHAAPALRPFLERAR